MGMYIKKPVVIEAYRTTEPMDIETLEGVMHANAGDYIITGVKDEKYPCKPDIFEATYMDDDDHERVIEAAAIEMMKVDTNFASLGEPTEEQVNNVWMGLPEFVRENYLSKARKVLVAARKAAVTC